MNPDPIQLEETAGGLKEERFSIRTSWEESRAGALERCGISERFATFVTDLAISGLIAGLGILAWLLERAQHQPRRNPGKPAPGDDRTDVRYRVWW